MWNLMIDKVEIDVPDPRNQSDLDELMLTITSRGISIKGHTVRWETLTPILLQLLPPDFDDPFKEPPADLKTPRQVKRPAARLGDSKPRQN